MLIMEPASLTPFQLQIKTRIAELLELVPQSTFFIEPPILLELAHLYLHRGTIAGLSDAELENLQRLIGDLERDNTKLPCC